MACRTVRRREIVDTIEKQKRAANERSRGANEKLQNDNPRERVKSSTEPAVSTDDKQRSSVVRRSVDARGGFRPLFMRVSYPQATEGDGLSQGYLMLVW
jgi:hypothetical protein